MYIGDGGNYFILYKREVVTILLPLAVCWKTFSSISRGTQMKCDTFHAICPDLILEKLVCFAVRCRLLYSLTSL